MMNKGGKGLFSKNFIRAFNILSISAMSLFAVPNSPFSIKSKSPANNIWVSFFEHFFDFHLNPWPRPINLSILSINYHHYEA